MAMIWGQYPDVGQQLEWLQQKCAQQQEVIAQLQSDLVKVGKAAKEYHDSNVRLRGMVEELTARMVSEPDGEAPACKAEEAGSTPVDTSDGWTCKNCRAKAQAIPWRCNWCEAIVLPESAG